MTFSEDSTYYIWHFKIIYLINKEKESHVDHDNLNRRCGRHEGVPRRSALKREAARRNPMSNSLQLQCLQDLSQCSNQGQALSKRLPRETKHSMGTRAWQFYPNSKLPCEPSLQQWCSLGWDFLRAASESEALVAQSFISRFHFHKYQFAL